jgi:hypothetical protein
MLKSIYNQVPRLEPFYTAISNPWRDPFGSLQNNKRVLFGGSRHSEKRIFSCQGLYLVGMEAWGFCDFWLFVKRPTLNMPTSSRV